MALVLPSSGDMGTGRLEDDDDALPPGTTDDDYGLDGDELLLDWARKIKL